ncbi:fluoride efflux transporter CrcB [Alkalicoccus chagannorensis]|uniref:fluoride efflux transporter CrcB n=1 Tax=Alkalicoccus chagannorensis TaxID=427072 RepID=UPI000412FC73|nr:fluoride efflux transporter CrcB [Alkalicoccus chagannorensis]
MIVLLTALAGAAGASLRWGLGLFFSRWWQQSSIPLPMLIVNLLGSFGLGLFLSSWAGTIPFDAYDDPVFSAVGVGFFGAFTTFSTFSVEAVTLLQEKKVMPFLWYTALSLIGSLGAFILGYLM